MKCLFKTLMVTPTQDNFEENLEGSSITEQKENANKLILINQMVYQVLLYTMKVWTGQVTTGVMVDYWYWGWGEQYGMSPQYAQYNGWFNMNE